MAVYVYTFRPWQALAMHRHPDSEEVFYILDGRCLFYVQNEMRPVDAENGVYVPSGASHAVLSCGDGATLVAVQGPGPVTSIYGNLVYFCPACGLETPLVEGSATGSIRKCPRCRITVRLTEAGAAFDAEPVEEGPAEEARA